MTVLCIFAPLRPLLEPDHWSIQSWPFVLLEHPPRSINPHVLQYGHASTNDLPAAHTLLLLLPACDVSLHRAALPALPEQKTIQALPHLIEERLAQPIENVHFAISPTQHSDPQRTIAAVDRAWFRFLCETLDSIFNRYKTWHALPDCLALPLSEAPSRQTARWIHYALGVDTSLIQAPQRAVLSVRETHTSGWGIRNTQDTQLIWPEMPVAEEPKPLPNAFLNAEHIQGLWAAPLNPLNLFQFEFSIHHLRPEHRWTSRWRAPLGLAASLLIVQMIGQQLHWKQLQHQAQHLEAQHTQIVREAVPNIGVIIDPVLQLKRHLSTLNQGNDNAPDSFLNLCASLAEAQLPPPQHLEYRAGQLIVEWTNPPPAPTLVRQLAAQGLRLSPEGTRWRIQRRGI
jgi:general secretion pathway protein L